MRIRFDFGSVTLDAELLDTPTAKAVAAALPISGSALTFCAVALIAEEKLDHVGRRLAQLVFWAPALQLLFGNLGLPGPGFIAPAFAAYLLHRLFTPAVRKSAYRGAMRMSEPDRRDA